MMIILVEYQNILMESTAIITCLAFPITLLSIDLAFIIYFCILGVFLIAYRYQHVKQERLLFLVLKNFERWQIVVEKTVPAHFIIQSFVYRTHQIQLYDSSKKFQAEFMKVAEKRDLKKSNFNEKYVQILKQLHIENIINRGKIKPISFPYTETPTLYDYLLDKHALLFENYNEENKNSNITFNLNKTKSFSKENQSAQKVQSFKIDTNPSRTSIANQSKIDIGKKLRKFSRNNSKKLSVNEKQQSFAEKKQGQQTNEHVEVSYFDEKLNQKQYFKVCIVPLMLQEPLLAISMEDITFVSLYHQKMKHIKQNIILNSLSYVKLKSKIDDIYNDISFEQPKLKKEIIYISHIIRAFTKIDPLKITFNTFSICNLIEDIKKIFPCIKQVNYKREITQPTIVEKKQQQQDKKSTPQKFIRSHTNSSLQCGIENQKDIELTYLQIKKPNMSMNNSDVAQLKLLNQVNLVPSQKQKDQINGVIYNHLNQQYLINKNNQKNNSNKQYINKQSIFGHQKEKDTILSKKQINLDPFSDMNEVEFSNSNILINNDIDNYQDKDNEGDQNHNNNNQSNNNLHNIMIKNILTQKRGAKRTLSHTIPFSQECRTLEKVNTFCNIIGNYEQGLREKVLVSDSPTTNYQQSCYKERLDSIYTQLSSPRCRLNTQLTNNNNYTEEKEILTKTADQNNLQNQANAIFYSSNRKNETLSTSQKQLCELFENLGVAEEKMKREIDSHLTEETQNLEYFICNNENMIQYVLIGVLSIFKEKNVEIEICLNQQSLYKSLKILIKPCVKMTLSKKLTYFQPEALYSLDDIYDIKSSDDPCSFSQLSEKMFQRLNEICLLLGPNKIRNEPDLIEVEFFAEQNKINIQKQQQI
ncbi:transmembrane protein, putative (macronuclear) [Tetrahymena thermophila SB210]|uniref:Transmembrane protein, putative n=1 Tax=Tetrahymena thermophila (strain SB210) TaxID=312017 RepID=Q23A18_TETTS|nr:transmembrane protein, putative [Tetrahymena thermophila SB210]EAR93345.2 transmembrane protein, putative [Tetrahymena thermophila SB210]|eukprot:XP_001013590.2 transmembrane protein, putative [Tetrahymena thermophila SB210]